MAKATFVIFGEDLTEHTCDEHLTTAIRAIVPALETEVGVAPLNDTAGFNCDHCPPPADAYPLEGFGGADITYTE